MEIKTCNTCKQKKPLEDFVKHPSYKDNRRGICKICYNKYIRVWQQANLEKIREAARQCRYELKLKVWAHYGNGKPACVKCGFDDVRALSIDHINGKGKEHRKELNCSSGSGFYYWLRKNNFPVGYQTLCMNCQFIKKVTTDRLNQERLTISSVSK